ncbi:MAG: DNA polymerase III subunit delta' [Betaproteobacteria bacterium]|nr:DNA polymerase III subunit delta' [Betaproteobacteria bacterium]
MTIFSWHRSEFEQLAQRLAQLPHALLLRGLTGIGKRGFAAAVARGLLCENPPAPLESCSQCQACRWMASDSHPDFRLLEPEAAQTTADEEPDDKKKKRDISIAQVRSLTDFINISAHRNGRKVVVIQPAEAMNVNAANALLKNLEEPPPNTFFLLVTDRPHMLPATIRSRCQQLPLRPPTLEEAGAWLKQAGSAHPELALAQAGGAPLLAAQLDNPEYWDARRQFIEGLIRRPFEPLALAERLASHAVPRLIGWLQRWTYDLASLSQGSRVRYNPDHEAALAAAAQRMPALEVARLHRELVRFQRVVNHPLNTRLLLEDWFLRYAQLDRG